MLRRDSPLLDSQTKGQMTEPVKVNGLGWFKASWPVLVVLMGVTGTAAVTVAKTNSNEVRIQGLEARANQIDRDHQLHDAKLQLLEQRLSYIEAGIKDIKDYLGVKHRFAPEPEPVPP